MHLHSVTLPHNFGRVFSSPVPGFVMGVGSIGEYLQPYEDCSTFLSIDGGLNWRMVRKDAHKYEFGDLGSLLVVVNDEDGDDTIYYSTDYGQSWCVRLASLYTTRADMLSGTQEGLQHWDPPPCTYTDHCRRFDVPEVPARRPSF